MPGVCPWLTCPPIKGQLRPLDWTKKQEVTYPPKVVMRFVLSTNAIVRHLTAHTQKCVILWSRAQTGADPGERYLQVLGRADVQAGDVLDPLIDLIHDGMFKRSEPGTDGTGREGRGGDIVNTTHSSSGCPVSLITDKVTSLILCTEPWSADRSWGRELLHVGADKQTGG